MTAPPPLVIHGDARALPLASCSIDAVVCDPPYGLGFMGKAWDTVGEGRAFAAWSETWAIEALRVLRPGGHLLAFGGTRMFHRLTCALEDVGFEVRDVLSWLYGSGFPKSMDLSKAIDKAAGATRPDVGPNPRAAQQTPKAGTPALGDFAGSPDTLTGPATPEAATWEGWGTALKPGWEPIVMARKPPAGTVAANVLEHGTGALNIDGCRIGWAGAADEAEAKAKNRHGDFGTAQGGNAVYGDFTMLADRENYDPEGRWPANVVLDEEAAAMLDEQTAPGKAGRTPGARSGGVYNGTGQGDVVEAWHEPGGASRFYYVAKPSRAEREVGLAGRERVKVGDGRTVPNDTAYLRDESERLNSHPTVKPIDLMAWLCRLVTPPGGIVLDPFTGSGSTGIAALREGFQFVGVEREAEYVAIARARLAHPIALNLFAGL